MEMLRNGEKQTAGEVLWSVARIKKKKKIQEKYQCADTPIFQNQVEEQ